MGDWGLAIIFLYVVCTAIRLARFNVQAAVEEKTSFMGLPSPAAAGILASYVLLSRWSGFTQRHLPEQGHGLVRGKPERLLNLRGAHPDGHHRLGHGFHDPLSQLEKAEPGIHQALDPGFHRFGLDRPGGGFRITSFTLFNHLPVLGNHQVPDQKSLGRLRKPAKAQPKIEPNPSYNYSPL